MIRNLEARCLPVTTRRIRLFLLTFCLVGFAWVALVSAQANPSASASTVPAPSPSPATPPSPSPNESQSSDKPAESKISPEISSHDQPATFKVNVKLVVVRAVVRDAQGHAVANLRKEDFQIIDRGKVQTISQFEVEHPGDLSARARQSAEKAASEAEPGESPANAIAAPERFVAYLFDDVHMQFGDLVHVRDAAERQFATLHPTDRAAIYSTSGQTTLDFTDDRGKLHETLMTLRPRPISRVSSSSECPQIDFYQADLIINKNDPQAYTVAYQEALTCPMVVNIQPPSQQATVAAQLVSLMSNAALPLGNQESQVSLSVLKQVVLGIAHMPGQRNVVLVSPGFITPQLEFEYNDIIDRALRSQVIINSLDARGLYTIDTLGDLANPPVVAPPPAKGLFLMNEAQAQEDLLEILANGTGGVFFHNSNDYDEGFRRTAQTPEYSYILAFVPQDLKLDGNFHPLKVTVKSSKRLAVQARRGYFAPKHLADPNEQAKQEIEEAMYSQEEIHNLPVKLHTQFFKVGDDAAKLVVLAHVDAQRIHYRKADGRNNDVLTCVSAVFNRNGNFLQALEKTVTMHWKDETLQNKLSSGVTLKSSFDIKPGSYLVRLVVRDSEGQLMSAENGTVEIR